MRKSDNSKEQSLVTRAQAAQMLGKSKSQIRRYEKSGMLNPITNEKDWRLIPVEEVVQLRRTLCVEPDALTQQNSSEIDVETTVHAFDLFDQGFNGIEAVRQLQITPEQAKQLSQSYSDLKGGFTITEATVRKMIENRLAMPEGVQNTVQWSRLHR